MLVAHVALEQLRCTLGITSTSLWNWKDKHHSSKIDSFCWCFDDEHHLAH